MSQKDKNENEKGPSNAQPRNAVDDSASTSQKIGASSSKILWNAFVTPPADSVTASMASLNSETSKNGWIAGSGEPGQACSSTQYPRIPENHDNTDTATTNDSFRSNHYGSVVGTNMAQTAFDVFVTEPPKLHASMGTLQATSSSDGKRLATSARLDQEDGAAVVALLSDPAFCIEDDPADEWNCIGNDCERDRNVTRIESHQSSSSHPAYLQNVENLLELIPDFQCHPEDQDPSGFVARQADIQPWLEIRKRYHDEVWGDILPLIVEAREEVRVASASDGAAMPELPATRRLGMILGHFAIPIQ